MIKILSLTAVLLALIAVPVMGEDVGMHGSVAAQFELLDPTNTPHSWEIDLHYNFFDNFAVGTSLDTYTYNMQFVAWAPIFTPAEQCYEIYVSWRPVKECEVKLSQWCNHPVYSKDGIFVKGFSQGVYLKLKYEF